MKKILLLTVGVVFAAGYAMQAAAETTLRMNLSGCHQNILW